MSEFIYQWNYGPAQEMVEWFRQRVPAEVLQPAENEGDLTKVIVTTGGDRWDFTEWMEMRGSEERWNICARGILYLERANTPPHATRAKAEGKP